MTKRPIRTAEGLMAGRWLALSAFRTLALPLAAALLLPGASGCGRGSGSTEPEAKVRLTKLLRLCQLYAEKNKKGPPDEQALRAFGQKLSAQERDEYLIGDDLDSIFTSPRDNQKYVVRYNLKPDARTWPAEYQPLSKGFLIFSYRRHLP